MKVRESNGVNLRYETDRSILLEELMGDDDRRFSSSPSVHLFDN